MSEASILVFGGDLKGLRRGDTPWCTESWHERRFLSGMARGVLALRERVDRAPESVCIYSASCLVVTSALRFAFSLKQSLLYSLRCRSKAFSACLSRVTVDRAWSASVPWYLPDWRTVLVAHFEYLTTRSFFSICLGRTHPFSGGHTQTVSQ